jgi:predicted phage terminase large subunit-like protein
MSSGEEADETGIVVCGKDFHGHGYVLDDVSGHYLPAEWAKTAIAAYHNPAHRADRIIAEINNGGEMVEHTLRMVDPGIPFTAVHASRGKVIRAEPVSALYEQGRVHHVGTFSQLEDQMTSFTVDFDRDLNGSPDRLDALVWAMTELLVEDSGSLFLEAWGKWILVLLAHTAALAYILAGWQVA